MDIEKEVQFLIKTKILEFGNFTLKSGKKSNYFFNLGKAYTGLTLETVSNTYCTDIVKFFELDKKTDDINIEDIVIFGPSYKGIPLAVSIATKLDVSFCFDRKEEKTHGDKGKFVGSTLKDKNVIVVDDVITSGGSLVDSVNFVKDNGGNVLFAVVYVDRMERYKSGELSWSTHRHTATAKDHFIVTFGKEFPIFACLTIQDIISSNFANSIYPEFCTNLKKIYGGVYE